MATNVQVPLDQWFYSSFVIRDGEGSKSFQELTDIYLRPANKFVAGFMGTTSFVEGVVSSVDGENVVIRTPEGLEFHGVGRDLAPGDRAAAAVRPETLEIVPGGEKGANRFDAVVERSYFTGELVDYQLRLGPSVIRAKTDTRRRHKSGDRLVVGIDRDRLPVVRP